MSLHLATRKLGRHVHSTCRLRSNSAAPYRLFVGSNQIDWYWETPQCSLIFAWRRPTPQFLVQCFRSQNTWLKQKQSVEVYV